MKYINSSQINIFSIYKNYPFIVKGEYGILYQLQHFKGQRTRPLKKIVTLNGRCRIESKWIRLVLLESLEIKIKQEVKKEIVTKKQLMQNFKDYGF